MLGTVQYEMVALFQAKEKHTCVGALAKDRQKAIIYAL
jgi:hypothetical protein